MASVINYIGNARYARDDSNPSEAKTLISPDGVYRWDHARSYSDNIVHLSPELQFKGYIEQLIAISYYISFYERGCNLLIDEYIDETITNFEFMFLPKFRQAMRDTNSYDQVLDYSPDTQTDQVGTARQGDRCRIDHDVQGSLQDR